MRDDKHLQPDGTGKRRNRFPVILLIALCLLVAVFAALLFRELTPQSAAGTPVLGLTEASAPGLDPDAAEDTPAPEAEEPGITIPGWGSVTIAADTADVTVDLYNPEENEGLYYLTFQLILADSGEVLYSSGLVPPGEHIRRITLSRPLAAGQYGAIIFVQPYTVEAEPKATNNANMETVLIVQ